MSLNIKIAKVYFSKYAYVENIKVMCVTLRSNLNIVKKSNFKILQKEFKYCKLNDLVNCIILTKSERKIKFLCYI